LDEGGPVYVDDSEKLAALVERLRGAPLIALDTEFMRERTYYARLCLIQIATDDLVAIVDPLAIEDRAPLWEVLSDTSSVKVLHSGVQDLEIIYYETGTVPAPIFDTQVAATLAGYPQQIGYGALVKDVTGTALDKGDTYSDWAKRPLSETQLKYAENDVRYLPEVYRALLGKLESSGRLPWVEDDLAALGDPMSYEVRYEELWRRVKRASSLDRRGLGTLRELAAWREREAQRRNIPRRWVLGDESLIEIARRSPKTREKLRSVRGVSDKLAKGLYDDVLVVVADARKIPDAELPRLEKRNRRVVEADGLVDMMAGLVKVRAREHDVAVPLLASRDDLEALASGEREGNKLLEGWRRGIVGDELVELIEGRVSMRVADGRVLVERVGREEESG
jgi:ribonuclease D